MGYTTAFEGAITIDPPLNPFEILYLRKFNETRRMDRTRGPYFVEGTGAFSQNENADVTDSNEPPAEQPSLWCGWTVTEDGTHVVWDGVEKFYEAKAWMGYLIDHFLKSGAHAEKGGGPGRPAEFAHFTFDHTLNGTIRAQGEDPGDRWFLRVIDNQVTRIHPDEPEVTNGPTQD